MSLIVKPGLLAGIVVLGGLMVVLLRRRRHPAGGVRPTQPVARPRQAASPPLPIGSAARSHEVPRKPGDGMPAGERVAQLVGQTEDAKAAPVSSHPAYPVAPASYEADEAMPAPHLASEVPVMPSGELAKPYAGMERRVGERRRQALQQGISAKPWYPEPPASYLGEERRAGGSQKRAAQQPPVSTHPAYPEPPPHYEDEVAQGDAADRNAKRTEEPAG